jgi:hypothetical protein
MGMNRGGLDAQAVVIHNPTPSSLLQMALAQ